MEPSLIRRVVEDPDEFEEEEDNSDSMKVDVAFQGMHTPFRYKHKKRSKVWEEYKPIFMNGKVQFAECLYCHSRMSCKDSNGTSHLWRHQKICPAKDEAAQRREKDSFFKCVLVNENEPVTPNDVVDQIITKTLDDIRTVNSAIPSRFKSKVWKEFTPIYVDEKLQSADCIHCHKRLSANKYGGRSHLNRHLQTCQARSGRVCNPQKDLKGMLSPSSLPNMKSRGQDELSHALTNGKVWIAEYSSRLPKASSSGDTSDTVRPIQVVPADQPLPSSDVPSLKKQRTSFVTTSADIGTRKVGQETAYQELARMIALHGYPLSIVEHEEMRRFVKNLNPMANAISHSDMEEHCYALFQKKRAKLKDKIALSSRRVSLSANIWTPDGAEPPVKYICLTAHFIDEDWKFHRMVIKFGMFWSSPTDVERMIHCKETCVPESELGAYNVIWDAIRDWNLDQKLLGLTSVGEVRNDLSTSKLKEMLIENKRLIIRDKLYNISCVDDVFNSIVSSMQENILHLVGDMVMDFFVAHTSSSSTQQQLLEVISQISLKCPQEDAKWWHKYYFRLEVLLHFKKLFPSEEVSPEDIRVAESICKILRTFYRVVEVISGPCSPTANIYFNEIWKVRTVLQEEASNDSGEIATLAMEMQEAFSEYWQSSYLWLSIPVILDPRFKISFIEFRLKRAFGTKSASYLSDIRETLRELFNEYCNHIDQPNGAASSSITTFNAGDSDSLEDWDQHLNEQASSKISSELDSYFEDGLVPRKDDFDILNWWMCHTTKYPTLATIAQDVLAMPASAAQSEAAFSSSGPVIPKHHSTLSIKTIEALVCTRDWMR